MGYPYGWQLWDLKLCFETCVLHETYIFTAWEQERFDVWPLLPTFHNLWLFNTSLTGRLLLHVPTILL